MTKRRRFSGELKAKVALEALRGDRTLQEIASKHQVHPNPGEHMEAPGDGRAWRTARQTSGTPFGGVAPDERLDGFDRAPRRDADRGPDYEPG